MHTRSEWKARGRQAMQASYWKYVLVSLLLSLTMLTFTSQVGGGRGLIYHLEWNGVTYGWQGVYDGLNGMSRRAGILLVLLHILVLNPLQVGGTRFMVVGQARRGQASLEHLRYPFENSFGNVILTMFLKELYILLWSLLLLIPGIIKSYSYRMVPYILAEQPDMPAERVFELSRRMMDGHKAEAFVLDLSFLLWQLLGAVTWQVVTVFYVGPYRDATMAEYYADLRDEYLAVNGVPTW